MLNKLIHLIFFLLIILGLTFTLKQTVHAVATCAADGYYKDYTYYEYTCNSNPRVANPGCVRRTRGGSVVCNSHLDTLNGVPYFLCGACGTASESCTEERRRDPETKQYFYTCSIKGGADSSSYKGYCGAATNTKWVSCGPDERVCTPQAQCPANACGPGFSDGCRGTASCGGCANGYSCRNSGGGNGRCVRNCTPQAQCPANACGPGFSDGCQGTASCGGCANGYSCNNSGGGNGRCVTNCTTPALPANRSDSGTCNAQNVPRITLNWTAVSGQTYNIRYRPTGANSWNTANNVTSGQNYTNGIVENGTYQWQVETTKSCGSTSGWSTSSNVNTPTTCAQAPPTPTGFNETSICTSETQSNNVITWTNVANANNYQIRYRQQSQATTVNSWTNPNTSANNSYNLNNVATNTTYIYQVLARNAAGSSAWSANQTFTTDTGATCQRFTISGNIFIDDGATPQQKANNENNYCAGTVANRTINVTGNNGNGSNVQPSGAGCGGFSITGLRSGDYTVSYNTPLPTDYDSTYPVNVNAQGNYSFDIHVGPGNSCRETHLQATCNGAGNVVNLNFGIVPVAREPWFQSVGGNVRSDTGKTDNIPNGATCSNTTTAHVSAASTSLNLDPGLVYSATLSDLGGSAAKANINNRLIVGKKFNPARIGQIRTSYSYISSVFAKGGITPENLFRTPNPKCSGASPTCTLPGSGGTGPSLAAFPNGVYSATNGLTIAAAGSDYIFPTNSNYIILVSGNLTINRNIQIPTSSTVIFAATGDIIIGAAVTRVDGVFSADRDFRVLSGGVPDNALTVQGNIIANAALNTSTPGVLDNQRDLGAAQNNVCPSLSVRYRPDFILHAPTTIKYPNYIIQEVAP